MLLVFDIGNTNVTIGCYKQDNLVFVHRLPTDMPRDVNDYYIEIRDFLNNKLNDKTKINGIIISSVVPELTAVISNTLRSLTNVDIMFVSNKLKTGLDIKLDNPSEIGADLIVGCVAAKHMFDLPCIILDLGTATTISVLDNDGSMVGGCIMPGVELSLNALVSKASLLNPIKLKQPKELIGKNTEDCICSGVVFGTACMIDGMVKKIQEHLGKQCSVVATGGLANKIINCSESNIKFCENLLLDGLKLIYNMNKGV